MVSLAELPGLSKLAIHVPTLPETVEPDALLSDALAHSQLHSVVTVAQRFVPHLTRGALIGATWSELSYWLEPADSAQPVDSGPPPRGSYRTANATLRPIHESDIPALYDASLSPQVAHRWRFRGRTPAPEEFRSLLFTQEVLCQFMVVPVVEPGRPVGLVCAYNADRTSGHCYIAAQRIRPGASEYGGLMVEGIFIFFQYLFDHFDLDKVYLELPEYNQTLIDGGAGSILEREGELKNHYYFGDRKWSLLIYALYRSRWEEVASAFRGDWPSEWG